MSRRLDRSPVCRHNRLAASASAASLVREDQSCVTEINSLCRADARAYHSPEKILISRTLHREIVCQSG